MSKWSYTRAVVLKCRHQTISSPYIMLSISFYLIFLDYDSVRREVLYKILIEFCIPRKLVRPIKMCLNETYSKIRIGKHLSGAFPQCENHCFHFFSRIASISVSWSLSVTKHSYVVSILLTKCVYWFPLVPRINSDTDTHS
jgi:hypothetical protein